MERRGAARSTATVEYVMNGRKPASSRTVLSWMPVVPMGAVTDIRAGSGRRPVCAGTPVQSRHRHRLADGADKEGSKKEQMRAS
jgi:hypothetical protein